MTTGAKYVRETLWAIAAKAAAFIFYYALIYYLTRTMSVAAWGNWSAFFALLNILMLVSDQGINTASKRYITEARRGAELAGIVRLTFFLRILASLGYTIVIAFLVPTLLRWVGQPEYLPLIQRSLLLVALYGTMEYFKHLFEALHQLRFTFLVNFLEHGCKLVLVLLLFREGSFFTIVIAFTLAVGIALAAGIVGMARTIPGVFKVSLPFNRLKAIYAYSLPIFFMSIGGFVALEVDTIMLKNLRTAYDTGIYSAAKNIVLFLPHISLAVSMGIVPGLSVFDEQTARASRRLYYRVLGGLTAVYVVICSAVAAFALFGMHFFFKPDYYAASLPLLALIPFVLLGGVSNYSAYLLDYRGFATIRAINFGLTIIANVLLNWWWIPKWGAVGAAAASSVAFVPYCALNLWQAHHAFSLSSARKK
jgi:O-antigen/teichoic acid export membrane protein